MEVLSDWKSLFPISSIIKPPLLLTDSSSKPILGPLFFNPKLKTLSVLSPLHLCQTHHYLSSKPTTSSPSFASLFPTPSFSSSPPVPTPTDSASCFSLSKLPISTPGAPKTMMFYTKVPGNNHNHSTIVGICWLLHCALCIGLLFRKFIILVNFPEFLV